MPDADWISLADFAAAAGIEKRSASKACAQAADGKLWKGKHRLSVAQVPGRGGRSGQRYLILAATLPPDVRVRLPAAEGAHLPARTGANMPPKPTEAQLAEARWREHWVADILQEAGSGPLDPVIRRIAKSGRYRDGALQKPSPATLHRWVAAYSHRGLAGLMPKRRTDRGQKRVIVSRRFDADSGFDETMLRTIASEIERYAKAHRLNAASYAVVATIASNDLARMAREQGLEMPDAELRAICGLHREWARKTCKGLDAAMRKKRDAKAFYNRDAPNVSIDDAERALDVVYFDVHSCDLALECEGETVRAFLIVALDDKTRYMWAAVRICRPGEGVTKTDIADATADFLHEAGLPNVFYFDNGSEYKRVAKEAERLFIEGLPAALDRMGFNTGRPRRSKPYRPKGKAKVERAFGTVESLFKTGPGYRGGELGAPKGQRLGQKTAPVCGTPEELAAGILEAVADYNARPHSSLGGLSPRQALEAEREKHGRPEPVHLDHIDYFLSEDRPVTVNNGQVTVTLDGQRREFHGGPLRNLSGTPVTLHVPLRRNAGRVGASCDGDFLGFVNEKPRFARLDPAGAQWQAQEERALNADIREQTADLPKTDTQKAYSRALRGDNPEPAPGLILAPPPKRMAKPSAAKQRSQRSEAELMQEAEEYRRRAEERLSRRFAGGQ
jgi:transposase InsO family protein